MNNLVFYLCLLLTLHGIVLSRSVMQRITLNNHVWEVPNEPGWDEVIQDVEAIQNSLRKCSKVSECHKIVNRLRKVFYRHPVSRKYFEENAHLENDMMESIFKWG
ncbi:unnamed protein product [Adineta steineri]|uniref:Uncharacterized protein n=1 Tax=Adineta steineri TaxID=433720 RepID=A0A815BXY1_9BILA|nr:unnamed protein product [Adineta steineri]CAF1246915.1 unnamed protein product [Adineta steineri]CAF1275679.1 unnamed protein product [Adineta steineri]